MDEKSEVVLDPKESALLTEYAQAARDIEQRAQGALALILRQHGLSGNWSLKGDRLVREA